jgi:D-alanyl-lipoteichoic acid acyltransferase DltB (MBOAT superfamily)
LLAASYVFYGIANWKMLPLLAGATAAFWGLGIAVGMNKTKPRAASCLTVLGVCLGTGILLYFKYLNFFIGSFADLFRAMGFQVNARLFNIMVPAGVSFFTFKLISYVIEIYRFKIDPEKDITVFAAYIAFFPAMMAGPIDRPGTFIPQLKTERPFRYDAAVDGCRQILWGAFKKVVISDFLAAAGDNVWLELSSTDGLNLLITGFLYAMQIYTDFSGYSDMSIGVGKLLGFRITANFRYPFYSRNIAEFWRGWHISLTSWLTDYVFMPLNIKFRDWGKAGLIIAIVINMLLVGMWHEAKITWVIFGLYNGILFIPLILSGTFVLKNKLKINKYGLPSAKDFAAMLLTCVLFTIGIVFTRVENLAGAALYWERVFKSFLPASFSLGDIQNKKAVLVSLALLVFEWYGFRRNWEYPIAGIASLRIPRAVRWGIYTALAFLAAVFLIANVPRPFLYFQF